VATLFRRNRRGWYSRFIIPADLRAVLSRREIQKSLGTAAYSEASLRAAVWEGRIASLLLRLRHHRDLMSPDQIKSLIREYITTRLEEWEEAWYSGERPACETMSVSRDEDGEPSPNQWQEDVAVFSQGTVEDTAQALKHNALETAAPLIEDFSRRYGLTLEPGTALYRRTARELLKAEQTIAKEIQERVQGNFEKPFDGSTTALPVLPVVDHSSATVTPSLSVASKAYLKDFERRAPGTRIAKANVLARFRGIIGDKEIHTITAQDCLKYRDTLAKLPAHMTKRYPGKSVARVLAEIEGKEGIEHLSLQTINQDLTHLRHFFGWAIAKPRRHITENPVEGLFYEAVESKQYETFTDEEVNRIFTSKEYTDQLNKKQYGRYWLPLILLYSGARREEIANLAVADLKTEQGLHYFDIAPDAARGRRLKNKASKRRVPIHSHLVELGLPHYVKQRRSTGEQLLFSKQRNAGKGRETVGDGVGKWFARLLVKEKISGKKSLHSFRPTVTTKLYEVGVDGETRRELLGHSGKDVHEQVYLRPPLQSLRLHLEKLNFRPLLKGLPRY
jgi:integrase